MKSPNKIRERDMDDDFLLSLKSGTNVEDAKLLLADYLRKDEVINAGQLPIQDLKSLLGLDDNSDLDTLLHTLAMTILKIIAQDSGKPYTVTVDKNGTVYTIKAVDTDGEEHNVVIYNDKGYALVGVYGSIMTDEDGSPISMIVEDDQGVEHEVLIGNDTSSNVDVSELTNQVLELQALVANLQAQVNNIESGGGSGSGSSTNYDNEIEQLRLENTELSGRINTYENTIRELERKMALVESNLGLTELKVDETMLCQSIIDRLDKVDTLETSVNNFQNTFVHRGSMKEGQTLYSLSNEMAIAQGRDAIVYATICVDNAEVEQAKTQKKEFIINIDNKMSYEYDDENDEYDEDEFTTKHKNDNVLIFDMDTETIRFVVINEEFVEFAGGVTGGGSGSGVSVTTKTFEIPLNQSVDVNRMNNLRKVPPIVLIKDKLVESRTYGQYINSEGYVTISNSASSFTIYNDSPYILEVMAIIVNSAVGGGGGE